MTGQGPSPAWRACVAAATLLAVDPEGLGGLMLRGPADPACERLLAIFRSLLPEGAPFRKLPVGLPDERLIGGLDLAATLSSGRPVLQRGLLAEADGGALVVPGAERMAASLAGKLALSMDARAVTLAREGFDAISPARFALVACDEGEADDPTPPAALADRLGLVASLRGATSADLAAEPPYPAAVAAARARLGSVTVSDAAVEALAEAAVKLGVAGLRPLIFARAAARASAALAGRDEADEADLALAGQLVLGPRATQAPAAEREEEQAAPQDQPEPDDGAGGEGEEETAPGELAERVLEAAAATLPAGLLEGEAQGSRQSSRSPGKAGASLASKRRGRPIGARPGRPENGARLDLVETLRAAAPWQKVRRLSPLPGGERSRGEAEAGEGLSSAKSGPHPAPSATLSPPGRGEDRDRILVRPEDFRVQRLKEKRRTLTIFAVDASGSAALHRLAEAKGAVELLLARAYVRRDEVALIAFRGAGAELVLPPTRSLARAKRALSGLPGGGGTPLAAGVEAAALVAESARRRGDTPTLVFLTDGAANVARDGTGGRERAQTEATAAAKALRTLGHKALVIDVSPRPNPRARDLADAMAARYLPLPSAGAGAVSRAVAAV